LFCFVASNLFFLSFFNSISCCLLVVVYSLCIGFLPWFLLPFLGGIGLGGASIPQPHQPWQCAHSSVVLLLGSLVVLLLGLSSAALAVLLPGSLAVLSVLLIGLSSAALASHSLAA
jgi:hypothetical protein